MGKQRKQTKEPVMRGASDLSRPVLEGEAWEVNC